ncbi:MAG: hypothetical protein ACU837_06520 [Gammaproteobacteria bacterium]
MNAPRFFKTVLYPSCILIATAGCAPKLVPFTQEMREQYDLSAEELRNLQFFVSSPVTLQHYMSDSEAGVTPKHTYRVINKSRVEEVDIKPGTPGVAVRPGEYSLIVSFEPGCTLEFGNVNRQGNYSLFARNWSDYIGEVDYCGKEYQAVNGSNNAHLLIDYEVIGKFKKKSRTAPGLKLK